MSRWNPRAAPLSNSRARLTSKKWKWEPTWTGRSPVFVTSISRTSRPSLHRTGSSDSTYSPGIMVVPSPDRVVDGDQLRAVRERGLDLDVRDHLGNPLHNVLPGQDRGAVAHQVRHGPPVPGPFDQLVGDDGHRLGVVQLEAPPLPPARQISRHDDLELLLLARNQVHGKSFRHAKWMFSTIMRSGYFSPRIAIRCSDPKPRARMYSC